jgi:hypothetical protein
MRSIMFVLLAVATLFAPLPAVAETYTPGQENQEDYPDGAGREQTFYACIACHGFKIVAQQGQTRDQWDDTLNWMTQKHGMPPMEGDFRKVVLDYLETAFPPRRAPGGWQNPFIGK